MSPSSGNPSPGHQKWPEHKVFEKPLNGRLQVEVGGEIIAESTNAIVVDEDDFPPRYYIPPEDINMDWLSGSNTPARCPFKGEGHYYNLNLGVKRLDDTAWTYDEPYDEHQDLKGRIAFHDEMPEVNIRLM